MLSIEKISLSRDFSPLISNLSLTIFPGTCLIIKGKNGSGKTSLLNFAAQISNLGSGTILYNGHDIAQHHAEYLSLICHIGHKNALSLELTVYENLAYWAKLHNRSETIIAASHVFKISEFFNVPVSKLSQGWQRKVALSRLLLTDASIWYLDEPHANLDDESSEILNNLIYAKCAQNGIVMIASHKNENIINSISLDIEDFK